MSVTNVDVSARSPIHHIPGLLLSDARFALCFAGQGGPYLNEMKLLRQSSARARRLIEAVAHALAAHVDAMPFADGSFFSEGFDVLAWLDAPPSDTYLAAVPVSFPLIFLTQLGHYEKLREAGFVVRERAVLAAGHSQGVMAAVAVSLAWEDGELGERAKLLAKFCTQVGLRMQQAWPLREHTGPTAMAALTGLLHAELQDFTRELPIEIALDNTLYRQVIAGEPAVLEAFRVHLLAHLDARKKARAAGQRGGRAPTVEWAYLPVSAPFHSQTMVPACAPLRRDAKALGFNYRTRDLHLPVLDTETGAPLAGELLDRLIEIQCVRPVSWRKVSDAIVNSGAVHVLDFGPGDALSKLSMSNLKGAPVHVWSTANQQVVDALVSKEMPKLPAVSDWSHRRPFPGPRVFLAGMTPTTVDVDIVCAASNAGFIAELAGGGQVTETILRRRVEEARAQLEPGRGFVFNALYLDPYLWKLHFGSKRLIERLAEEGAPIIGVTISAGVPPLEEALSVLRGLHRVGVTENSLKPGNDREIGEALAIAKALAPLPLTLQIEGGKAGGHHSWEDLDDLLLRHYAAMRALPNVRIAVGGGIARKEQVAAYVSGEWALHYGQRAMPVDAVFIGTAAMATREAKTSPAVKEALRAARGTTAWVKDRAVEGDVTSGRSQLDASIHYLENAAAAAGRLLDSIGGKVEGREDEIIAALAKTAKPYFGDVETMSYGAWLERYVALCAVGTGGAHEDGVWLDVSYRERFVRCLALAEARLCEDKTREFSARVTSSEPHEALAMLFAAYPHAEQVCVHPDDASAFIAICRLPGKPVCFVPVIDAEVRRWYKADSLWQAQDARFSADAVLALPGPASLSAIEVVDQPVAELLATLCSDLPGEPARVREPHDEMRLAARCFDPRTGRMRKNPLQLSPEADAALPLALSWRGYLACDEEARIAQQTQHFRSLMQEAVPSAFSASVFEAPGDTRGSVGLAFVYAWKEIFAALTACQVDLLRLVHETNSVNTHTWPPQDGPIEARAEVAREEHSAEGRRITVSAELRQAGVLLAEIDTRFFVREPGLTPSAPAPRRVHIIARDAAEQQFLREQPWFQGEIAIGERRDIDETAENAAVLAILRAEPPPREHLFATPQPKGEWQARSPKSMRAYAQASGDYNPLHTDERVAKLAGFAHPIVHGMWTAGFAAHRVARAFGVGSDALRAFRTEFTAPLLCDTPISVRVEHIGMRDGAPLAAFSVSSADGEVLRGTATIAAAATAYVFPGQGIQSRGMGMAGYARSAAARAVWDEADAHTRRAHGFSLLQIVRDNPVSLRIKGQLVTHPQGVLFLTQFTQVAMVVLAMAQVAELRADHALVPDAFFAGHSVGEYSALSALAGVLPLCTVVDVVYDRGLTMDRFVPRDGEGRSPFAMGVVRPHYAGLNEAQMQALVAAARGDDALEIVNFNIRGRQYSVTGHVAALARLQAALQERAAAVRASKPAYLPVPGIDVPFHSTLLRDGVARFRETLDAAFPRDLEVRALVGRYIPNLVAKPFTLDAEFIADVRALTDSPALQGAVSGRTLLIELLAYQFASPVRWIETQDILFAAVSQFVEVGVAEQPTLMNMALASRQSTRVVRTDLRIINSEQRVEEPEAAPAEAVAAPAVVATPAALATAPAAHVEDLRFSHAAGLYALLAWQLNLRVDQIQAHETVDELCSGNSAKRNQVLADIGNEFSVRAIDGAHEVPLAKLAETLAAMAPGYAAPGKYLAALMAQRLSPLLQPARIEPKKHLAAHWGLGDGRTHHVLVIALLATRPGESTRGGAFGPKLSDPMHAAEWLDACVAAHAEQTRTTISRPQVASATQVDSGALQALEERIFGEDGVVGRLARALVPETAPPVPMPEIVVGEAPVESLFQSKRVLALCSAWAWGRRDVFMAAHGEVTPRAVGADALRMAEALANKASSLEVARRLRAFTLAPAPLGETALVTGAGKGSIAIAVIERLLARGARVVATTSSFGEERLQLYRDVYRAHAIPGAELHVVPFNQGSFADCDALIAWLRAQDLLPTVFLPFAALSESGFVGDAGQQSLATLRVQLVGVERLLGALAHAAAGVHVVLPLSPNHGSFGGDGMYAESKAALEVLLHKWHSEPWGKHASITGARIGWVRGTGLMAQNDSLAEALERDTGLRTWSTAEMADALLQQCFIAGAAPQIVSLTGGFEAVADLSARVSAIRTRLATEKKLDELRARLTPPRATLTPAARTEERAWRKHSLASLPSLDHLDLDRVVVVIGYGEVGPWGSARTRWAMEKDSVLSLEAAVELAWMMGLVQASEAGFVDAESKEPIADYAIKERYEARILAHAGVRLVEAPLHGFDPAQIATFVDVHLERDFEFTVPSADAARGFAESGALLYPREDGSVRVLRKRGATLRVPKALSLSRLVAGQIPSGWSAERYGIPAELVAQVDRTTLFNLIATVEAFLSAGIEPEELYRYLHPSRVGTTQSSGIGGMQKLSRMYQDGKLGRQRQADVLQETLVNVISGWTVQAYVGSYGPISSPVGACATAALSLADACDKIAAGRADIVVTGGCDDYNEEGAIGFSDMGATADSIDALAHGISPRRLSRPNDTARSGFVEAQGAGAILLARASTAVQLGLPVYGIVAYAAAHSDGINASVPAPGQGLLAVASETPAGHALRVDACGFQKRRAHIGALTSLPEELRRPVASALAHDLARPEISPLRAALAVYGLQADDIAFVSKHDTSTKANDRNENRLHATLQAQLGRSPHLPLYVVSQKSLTGHPKGAAAAWQMIGALQAMAEGVLPGNRSLDDVDVQMQSYGALVFSDRNVKTDEILRACLVTSLGFGHVGALVCLLHPALFWRALTPAARAAYEAKLAPREREKTRRLQRVLAGKDPLVVRRTERPFVDKEGSETHQSHEAAVLLDAGARLHGKRFDEARTSSQSQR